MPFPFNIFKCSLEHVFAGYVEKYSNSVQLRTINSGASEACSSGELSPQTNSFFLPPLERDTRKYFGRMILKALLELSKASSKEIQKACSSVFVFCRSESEPTYSAIQSIFIPGLFYIELGNFDKCEISIEQANHRSCGLVHLEGLKTFGFIPLLQADLNHAEKIRFRPGGLCKSSIQNSEFIYPINKECSSLLTQDVLIKFMDFFEQNKIELPTQTRDSRPKFDRIIERKNLFIRALTTFRDAHFPLSDESDSDEERFANLRDSDFFNPCDYVNRRERVSSSEEDLSNLDPSMI